MFSRLQSILRSYFHWQDHWQDTLFYQKDLEEAWEELNEFLRQPKAEPLRGWRTYGSGAGTQFRHAPPKPDPEEHLRQDYANLEVPFKSDFPTVKKQYKTLLRKYHPDQFAQDAEKYSHATEITKKLNESFQRIKAYREGRS
ncbi:MAG: J domain-containing protein [Spirochaetales bacterium]